MPKATPTVRKQTSPALSEVRLSPTDALIISCGLHHIVDRHRRWMETGELFISRLRFEYRFFARRMAAADLSPIVLISELEQRTKKFRKSGGRLKSWHPTAIEACMLAVRVFGKLIRHGHLKTNVPKPLDCCARLLKKLDKHRKRQKRKIICDLGEHVYLAEHALWQRFVWTLRKCLLRCTCGLRSSRQFYKLQRWRVATFSAWAAAELQKRRVVVPDREVRRLVRMMLRYVRLGRRPYDIRFLHENQTFTKRAFADFIQERNALAA